MLGPKMADQLAASWQSRLYVSDAILYLCDMTSVTLFILQSQHLFNKDVSFREPRYVDSLKKVYPAIRLGRFHSPGHTTIIDSVVYQII